jgi:hypothetical protein
VGRPVAGRPARGSAEATPPGTSNHPAPRNTRKRPAHPNPAGHGSSLARVVFIPGVNLAQTIAQQQDFDRSASIYGPDIQQSKLLKAHGNDFRIYYRIHRHVLIESPTYNATFDIQFFPLDRLREYSRSYSTRIAEIIDPGMPNETEKPVGQDLGYLWRLNTYTRYEERDGGVYIQTEFIALSRSVPAIFAWLVDPYVRSVPQEYLVHILGAARNDLMNSHEAGAPAGSDRETPEASAQPIASSAPVGAGVAQPQDRLTPGQLQISR